MQGIILLYKPKGMTSFQACAAVRRLCGTKRVGHTGTLDPLAEGVLPILVGRATALASFVTDGKKSYTARVRLGLTTDTEDITGEILTEHEVSVEKGDIEAAASRFLGDIMQVPPMFSAISRDGVRLYKLAREGKVVEREPRAVRIEEIEVRDFCDNEFTLEVTCSKGTYIRSLCRDIGEALGCGAVMTELIRTETAGFSLAKTVKLSELTPENIKDKMLSADCALPALKKVFVTEKQAIRFSNGGELSQSRLRGTKFCEGELYRVCFGEVMLGLGRAEGELLTVECVINDKDGSDCR